MLSNLGDWKLEEMEGARMKAKKSINLEVCLWFMKNAFKPGFIKEKYREYLVCCTL